MANKKILFAASEATPFISTGGMGQVIGALPKALKNIDDNMEISIVIPLYDQIKQRFSHILEFAGETRTDLAWRNLYCGVYKTVFNDITYYFIDNEYYFRRDNCYGYFDDGERFAYFSKAIFSMMELLDYKPDIIHANDWQTALTTVYIKTHFYNQYPDTRTIFTIHNMEYQGKYPLAVLGDVFDLEQHHCGIVEYDGGINLMKAAVICSDKLTTVSPTYANEIKLDKGFGLEPIINQNAYKLTGIINGIDLTEYDPQTDPILIQNYSAESPDGKTANKLAIQKIFGLTVDPRKMMFCVITRLTPFKGIDLITYIIEELLKFDVQFLLLGTGEHQYELFFSELAMRHPGQVGVNIAYNPEIANKIYAGADCMIMPSRSEPCGLAQMLACRYGTIPIVRKTGGLSDTIKDCRGGDGNGFVFTEYDAGVLLETIRQAIDLYTYGKEDWTNLVKKAMESDFSWELSAKKYLGIYKKLL